MANPVGMAHDRIFVLFIILDEFIDPLGMKIDIFVAFKQAVDVSGSQPA